ncbi:tRNA pseudouridine(55) synthase TruB [Ethanoligenens sp.]|uniref:tRNA pseudouridine(55) synthase TruB n=1 Tax=Ethanoligenens sp. TaxID=2099655 RepID=UPI0039E739F5
MDGILILNKPAGITSFGAVARVRGITHVRKVGHAGTLDPMATGVLPLFLGRATRAIGLLPCNDKTYIARMRLGVRTDTGDCTGKVLETRPVCAGRSEVERALPAFTGAILQVPPMYSAVHKNGERLYELARRGEVVEREARPVTIYALTLLDVPTEAGEYALSVSCSSGTYIRTLVEDIGASLGCGATMTALQRTAAAGFSIAQARSIEEVEQIARAGMLQDIVLDVQHPFDILNGITITPKQVTRFCNGGFLSLERVEGAPSSGLCRVHAPDSSFLGLGEIDQGQGMLRVKCVFAGGEGNGNIPCG